MIDKLDNIQGKLEDIFGYSKQKSGGRAGNIRYAEIKEDPDLLQINNFDLVSGSKKRISDNGVKYGAYADYTVPNRYSSEESPSGKLMTNANGTLTRPDLCPPCPPCKPTADYCQYEDELCRDDSKFTSVHFSGKATIGTEIVKMFETIKFAFNDNGEIMAVKYNDSCSRVNSGALEQELNLGFVVIPPDSLIDKDVIIVSGPTVFSPTFEVPAGTEISRDGMMILKDEIAYHTNGDMSLGAPDGLRYLIARKEIESILSKDFRMGDVVVTLKNGFSTSDGKTFSIAGIDLSCCGARKQITSIEDRGRVFRLINGVEIVNDGGVAKAITEFGQIPLRDHRVCLEQSNGILAIRIDVGKKGHYTIGAEDKNPEQQILTTPCATKFTHGGALNFVMKDKDVYYLDINGGRGREDLNTGDLALRLADGSEYLVNKDAYCLKEANYCGSDISIELLRNHPFNFEVDKSGQLIFLGTGAPGIQQNTRYGNTPMRNKVAINSAEVEIQQDGSIVIDGSIRFPSDNRVVELLDKYGNIVGVITEDNLNNSDPNDYKIDDSGNFKIGDITYFSQGYAMVKDVALDPDALNGITKEGAFVLSSGIIISTDGTAVVSAHVGGLSGAISKNDYDVLSNGTLVAGNEERTISIARDGIKVNGVKFPDAKILIHNSTPTVKLCSGASLSIALNNEAPTFIVDDNGGTKPISIKDIYQNCSFSFLNGIKFEIDKYILPNGNAISASQNIHVGQNGELIVKIGDNIVYTLDYLNSSPIVTVYGYADANSNTAAPIRMDLVDSIKVNPAGDIEFPTGNILHADGSGITVLGKIRIDDSSKGEYREVAQPGEQEGETRPEENEPTPTPSSGEEISVADFPISWTTMGSVKVGRIEFNAKDSFLVYNNSYSDTYCSKDSGIARVPAECVRGIESDLCKGGGLGTEIPGTIVVNLINGLSMTNYIDAEGEKLLVISNEVGTSYADAGQFPKEARIGNMCNVEIDIENCVGGVLDTYSYDGTEVKRIDPNGSSYAIVSAKWTDNDGDGSLKTITFGASVYAGMPANMLDHCLVAGDASYVLRLTETEEFSCDAGRIDIRKPTNIQIAEITPVRSESFLFQLSTGDKMAAKKYGGYIYGNSEGVAEEVRFPQTSGEVYGAVGPILDSGGNEIMKPNSNVPIYPNDITIGGPQGGDKGVVSGGIVKLSEIKISGGNVVDKATLEPLTFDDGTNVKESEVEFYYSGKPLELSSGVKFTLKDLDAEFRKELFDNDNRTIQRSSYKYLTPRGGILLSSGFTLLPDGAIQTDVDSSGFGRLMPSAMSYCAIDPLTGAFEAPGFVRDVTLSGPLENPIATLDFGTFASGCGSEKHRLFGVAPIRWGASCNNACDDGESSVEIMEEGADALSKDELTQLMGGTELGTQSRGFAPGVYGYSHDGSLIITVSGGRKLYFDGQNYYLDEKPTDAEGNERHAPNLVPSPVLNENGDLKIEFINKSHDLII